MFKQIDEFYFFAQLSDLPLILLNFIILENTFFFKNLKFFFQLKLALYPKYYFWENYLVELESTSALILAFLVEVCPLLSTEECSRRAQFPSVGP